MNDLVLRWVMIFVVEFKIFGLTSMFNPVIRVVLRVCLVIVFENNYEKQFLRTIFENCFIMYCRTNYYLKT